MQNKEKMLPERKEAVESQNLTLLVTMLNSNKCLIIKKRDLLKKSILKNSNVANQQFQTLNKMKKPIICNRLKRSNRSPVECLFLTRNATTYISNIESTNL